MCRINLPEGEFPRLGVSQPSASKLRKASIRELAHFFAKIEALSIMRNQQHSVFALPKELQDGLATVAISAQVSDFRPGCEIRGGGSGGRSMPEDKPCPHVLRESLAKRCSGALGRKLQTRAAGPHHRGE